MANLRDSEARLKQQVEELKAENSDLKENLKVQVDKNTMDKDNLHGEVIAAKQRQEEAVSEAAHLKISYDRISQEKELLEQQVIHLKSDASNYKAKVIFLDILMRQIDEQLEIHAQTRSALEKAQASNHSLQEKVKELEAEIEELNVEFYKKQIAELQYKLSSSVAELKAQVLEKQAIEHHHEQIKETMKQAVQKQNALEQEVAHLKLTAERVNFFKRN
jgi:hypothetical protein